jgi:hypothetical protein
VILVPAALAEVTSGYKREQHHKPNQSEQWKGGHSES